MCVQSVLRQCFIFWPNIMGGGTDPHTKTHQYLLYFKAKDKVNTNNNNISSEVAELAAATKHSYIHTVYVSSANINIFYKFIFTHIHRFYVIRLHLKKKIV